MSVVLQVLTGLIALGFVVFVHELGHFIAAIFCGVEVQTFSIGWGPILFRKKIKGTEYRISALPLGGYCGMKGEHAFNDALEKGLDSIPHETGSFYSTHPLKRIIISVSGPLANLLLAVLCFTLVNLSGLTYRTYENRIIPAQLSNGAVSSPALEAGLMEGDRILSIDGTPIHNFTDLQQYISVHPQENLELTYERNGTIQHTRITPELDKKTGAGKIGVYPYIPLNIQVVQSGSAAETIGLRKGDRILSLNGKPVAHYLQFETELADRPEQIQLQIDRDGIVFSATLVILYTEQGQPVTGLQWESLIVEQPGKNFPAALAAGFSDTGNIFQLTIKSIGLLFSGVSVTDAVSGPVRITMLIGEVARSGMTGVFELLAIICISLFMMNLLPIPVLDGGVILLSVAEMIKRAPLKPKVLYYVQFIGIAFIMLIFIVAVFGDIKYLLD